MKKIQPPLHTTTKWQHRNPQRKEREVPAFLCWWRGASWHTNLLGLRVWGYGETSLELDGGAEVPAVVSSADRGVPGLWKWLSDSLNVLVVLFLVKRIWLTRDPILEFGYWVQSYSKICRIGCSALLVSQDQTVSKDVRPRRVALEGKGCHYSVMSSLFRQGWVSRSLFILGLFFILLLP